MPESKQFAHYCTATYIASLEESYLLKVRSLCRGRRSAQAIALELAELSDNFVTVMNFARKLQQIKERYYA